MAEPIIPSDRTSPNPVSRTICHVCQKQFSQYTCPRCNSRYCSLHCYKSHSVRCTESFMRENVVEELKHVQPDDGTKKKMLDILKRLRSEEEEEEEEDDFMDEDGEGSSFSEETMKKIFSGDQISFNDLSADEKKRFRRALASGELSKMIQPWDPWWLKPSAKRIRLGQEGNQLVLPVVEESSKLVVGDAEESSSDEIPAGPEARLPPIRKLSLTEPSPLLPVHLVDIIYSYCFALRLYNGDWRSDPIESSTVVLSISSVLGHGGQPESMREALSHCLEQTCSPAYKHTGGLQLGMALVDDILSILSLSNDALICLLCDLQRLLQGAEKELRSEKGKLSRRSEIKSQLKLAQRKVYFMMCWAHEQPREVWSSLATLVRAEKEVAADHGEMARDPRPPHKPEKAGKVLIEEI